MKSPIVRFAVFFFASLLAFSVLSVATALQNHLQIAEGGIAHSATWVAQRAGSAAMVVNGNIISTSGMTLNINHECTGVFVLFVLASFIGAYPAPVAAKAIGIGVGVTALSLLNVL